MDGWMGIRDKGYPSRMNLCLCCYWLVFGGVEVVMMLEM